MATTALITGGAGFIGSHLADELGRRGWNVRALDSLIPQVHGDDGKRPAYLDPAVELQVGDVRDPQAVQRALAGVDAVFHFAARVGVGQSMYRVADYTSVNDVGTAVLMEALSERPVERLVVASSMSIYGEGRYRRPDETTFDAASRQRRELENGQWEPTDPDGIALTPVPTPEDKSPTLESVYALNKYNQERLALILGRAYKIPTVALRFFNVYGTRQALSNPYTGVLAIFASRLLNGRPPLIFEDGAQKRDFVSVKDVARACCAALTADADGHVFNIGSGNAYTVTEVAERLARVMGRGELTPEITGEYRVGDIRHCYADIGAARQRLEYRPSVDFDAGLTELAGWLETQVAVDHVASARQELSARGLTV